MVPVWNFVGKGDFKKAALRSYVIMIDEAIE